MSSTDYDRLVDQLDVVMRERDEARAQVGRLATDFNIMHSASLRQEDEIDRLKALLREVEWSGDTWGLGHKCPLCGGLQTKQEGYPVGHKKSCRLKAALEGHDAN